MFFKFLKITIPDYKKISFQIFVLWISIFTYLLVNIQTSDLRESIKNDVNSVLGGDIKITGTIDLQDKQKNSLYELGKKYNFEISKKIEFYTSIKGDSGEFKMIQVIGIENNFPFYAKINYQTINKNYTDNIYSDPYTFNNFSKNGEINLLNETFKLKGFTNNFPQNLISFYNEKRFVLIPLDKLKGINFDQSRINYSYLIKLNSLNYKKVIEEIKLIQGIRGNFQIIDYKELSNHLQFFIDDFEHYANIATIVFLIICGLLILINISIFFIDTQKNITILKILGLKPGKIAFFIFLIFFITFLLSYTLNLITFFIFTKLTNIFYSQNIFNIFYLIFIKGFVVGFFLIFFSASFLVYQFSYKKTIAMKVDFIDLFGIREKTSQIIIFFIMIILIYYTAFQNFFDGVIFGIIIMVFIFILIKFLDFILFLLYKSIIIKFKKKYFYLFDSFRSNILPGNKNKFILIGFMASFICFLVIGETSIAFINKLLIGLENQPNIYVVNITEKDLNKIKDYKDGENMYSSFFAQLITINGKYLKNYFYPQKIPKDFLVESYITDSYLKDMIFKGKEKIEFGEISIDKNYASKLKVDIGDTLGFLLAGREFNLKISNIRQTQIRGTTPFFNFQVNPDQFKKAPKTFFYIKNIPIDKIDSFKKDIITTIGDHISIVEADKIIIIMRNMSVRLISLCWFLLFFMLILVFFIFKSSIKLGEKGLKNKIRIYNLLGANKEFLSKNFFLEYFLLMLISHILGLLLAILMLYYITIISDFFILNLEFINNVVVLIFFYLTVQMLFWCYIISISVEYYKFNKKSDYGCNLT